LQTAAAACNRQRNQGTQFTPSDAVKMTHEDDLQEVKGNAKEAHTREDNRKDVVGTGPTRPEGRRFDVGDASSASGVEQKYIGQVERRQLE
jgi:hypothetical protein